MQDLKMTNSRAWKMTDQITGPENARSENDGPGHFKADVIFYLRAKSVRNNDYIM